MQKLHLTSTRDNPTVVSKPLMMTKRGGGHDKARLQEGRFWSLSPRTRTI